MLPPVGIEHKFLITSDFKFNNSPFWSNLSFASETETLGSLYSYALLIQLNQSKSKNKEV